MHYSYDQGGEKNLQVIEFNTWWLRFPKIPCWYVLIVLPPCAFMIVAESHIHFLLVCPLHFHPPTDSSSSPYFCLFGCPTQYNWDEKATVFCCCPLSAAILSVPSLDLLLSLLCLSSVGLIDTSQPQDLLRGASVSHALCRVSLTSASLTAQLLVDLSCFSSLCSLQKHPFLATRWKAHPGQQVAWRTCSPVQVGSRIQRATL